jgi:predicted nucleotidyltransferase
VKRDDAPPPIDVTTGQWHIVRTILHRHLPGRSVWAFGSRVKGTARPYSDLDLAVMGNEPVSIATLAAAKEAFSESDLPWRVDLVDWSSLGEEFRKIIKRDHVLLLEAQGLEAGLTEEP